MLGAIRRYFAEHIQPESAQSGNVHAVRLATAALLIEAMHADQAITEEECRAVEAALTGIFALTDTETAELVRLAKQEVAEATSLYQFTNLVDKHFTPARKIQLVELLWTVVFSDTIKDKHEEHLVRRIADLLHVPHSEFVRTRHFVESGLRR